MHTYNKKKIHMHHWTLEVCMRILSISCKIARLQDESINHASLMRSSQKKPGSFQPLSSLLFFIFFPFRGEITPSQTSLDHHTMLDSSKTTSSHLGDESSTVTKTIEDLLAMNSSAQDNRVEFSHFLHLSSNLTSNLTYKP
uniref:Uncharacterized protein n=1 Tax=Arundo donax TaxID=35708 RepID=A0A0A9B824_ARUDO